MRNRERLSLVQIQAFLEAKDIELKAVNRRETYDWIAGVLCEQEYWKQNRCIKGILRLHIGKMTGLSR